MLFRLVMDDADTLDVEGLVLTLLDGVVDTLRQRRAISLLEEQWAILVGVVDGGVPPVLS